MTAALSALPAAGSPLRVGSLALIGASGEARRVADWIDGSKDNGGLPFIIVDKVNARLFLFDATGAMRGGVPALIGSARGDDAVPGIGTRKLSAIRPAERTTPAGRFVAQLGHDSSGDDILWIDYDAAIALHRASDRKPGPSRLSRLQRLRSANVGDRRASLGCIGVSARFYENFVRPIFGAAGGIVYILPETRAASAQFRIPAFVAASVDAGGV